MASSLDTDFESADTASVCEGLQKEEYEVLESIYPECVSSEMTNRSLRLEVPIEFGEPRNVYIQEDVTAEHSSSEAISPIVLSLSSLPPITVTIILPALYPINSPPTLTSIRASRFWLPETTPLFKILSDLWQPREGVLYHWIEFLRNGEFLEALSLIDESSAIRISHPSPPILAKFLQDSDVSSNSLKFSQHSYPCSICLSTVKGSKWRVGCPDPGCVKVGREADAEEVARVVAEKEVERWRWLRIKRNLDRDTGAAANGG
ncbi:hypothetical protein H0H92_004175 [Tricholoma furcatifolium]|nr:hypothetical protein H0H92_004175 [Tricholoma furcatifolium]